jgi:hypothetical protein
MIYDLQTICARYSLSVQQTPSRPITKLPKKNLTVDQKKHSKKLGKKQKKAQP